MQAAQQPEVPAPTGRRVLVAEDSPVTKDLLQMVLTRYGHSVDIVDDGLAALEAMMSGDYEVALLDYHMPGMNGLEVVRTLREDSPPNRLPRFVAITGDVEGLLGNPDDCELFDRVVAKPLDMGVVCRLIEEIADETVPPSIEQPNSAPDAPQAPATSQAIAGSEAVVTPLRQRPRRSPIEDLDYRFLRWPEDKALRLLNIGVANGARGRLGFDAVLIHDPVPAAELSELWYAPGLHLLPVIDLSGSLGGAADLDGSKLVVGRVDEARDLIESFRSRTANLHRDLVMSEAPADMLLGRILASGGRLQPRLSGGHRSFTGYNTTLDAIQARYLADRLVDTGLLRTMFFDRLHQCANCSSSRFIVQELCPNCQSAQLEEGAYLHHFRCAYQAPETEFRSGADLVCPKCSRELRQFGRDYDRPGMMVTCESCGTSTSEPAVGFHCVDCDTRYDGDAVQTVDIYSYELTDQAVGYLEVGRSFLGFAQRSLRFADLPLDLVIALNAEARKYNEIGQPFTLVSIAYERERDVIRDLGPRQFASLRELFLETLGQRLDDACTVAKGQSYDFALIRDRATETARAHISKAGVKASASLSHDIGPVFTPFGPEDIT